MGHPYQSAILGKLAPGEAPGKHPATPYRPPQCRHLRLSAPGPAGVGTDTFQGEHLVKDQGAETLIVLLMLALLSR